MPTGTISQVGSVGGLSIQSAVTRTANLQIGYESDPLLPPAKVGTLSARTTDTAGTLTLEAEHGITEGQVINIFWIDANGVPRCAYGATVGVVAGNDVPFTGAAGDVLPAESYAITASVVVVVDVDFDGDLVEMIFACATCLSHIAFRDVTPTVLKAVVLPAAESWYWASRQGIANPLAGNPVNEFRASNGEALVSSMLRVGLLYDGQS